MVILHDRLRSLALRSGIALRATLPDTPRNRPVLADGSVLQQHRSLSCDHPHSQLPSNPHSRTAVAAMAESLIKRSAIAARDLSPGGIAGVTVGVVIFVAIIILLSLPFILRAIRNARLDRENAAFAEMGQAPGPGAAVVGPSPTSVRPGSHDFPSNGRSGQGTTSQPVKDIDVDGNSYEYTPPATKATSTVLPALDVTDRGVQGALGPDSSQTESPLAIDPPKTLSIDATAAAASHPPAPAPAHPEPRRESSHHRRKSSRGSVSHVIDAVFRRGSTRSARSQPMTPVRSAGFDTEEPYYPVEPVPENFTELNMTGESASYYSSAPLSPPITADSPLQGHAPFSLPNALQLMAMPGAVAGTPLYVSRTSGLQPPQQDYAPMSPISPPIKIEESFEESDEDASSKPPPSVSASPAPPSVRRVKIPSPPLPAPGTVNPMDVWSPVNPSERVYKVEAELDRIENSPPPAIPDSIPTWEPPVEQDADVDTSHFSSPEALQSSYNSPSPPSHYQPVTPEPSTKTYETEFTEYTGTAPIKSDPSPSPAPEIVMSNVAAPAMATYVPPAQQWPVNAYMADANSGMHQNFNALNTVQVPVATHSPQTPYSDATSNGSPRTFTCEECSRVFDQIHKLNHHKRYHERPHECTHDGCGRKFGTKTHLDRHINDKHMKTRKYHCTETPCPYSKVGGKSFPRKDNWRRHMQNKHGFNPDYEPIEINDEVMAGT